MSMQGLNNAIKMHYFMSENNECKHQTTYYGVINVNVEEKTIGSVDIWRCSICMKMFCEEKQLGIEEILSTVLFIPFSLFAFSFVHVYDGKPWMHSLVCTLWHIYECSKFH